MRKIVMSLGVWLASVLPAQELTLPMEPAQIERLGIETVSPQAVQQIPLGEVPAQVTVPPQAEVLVSAPVAGRVEKITVTRGESVVAGQVLVVLVSPELLLAQQRLLEAYQEAKLAQADYQREKLLFEEGIIAQSRFLKTEKLYRQAQVVLTQAKAELVTLGMADVAVTKLLSSGKFDGRLVLKAPISGVVASREVAVGQWVDKLAPLLRLTATSPLWLEMAVPVSQVSKVSVGAPVRVEAHRVGGKVILIGETVDPTNQTVLVRAKLDESKDLKPGRHVTVTLFQRVFKPVLKIPSSALVEHQGKYFVFVRTAQGFELRQVEVTAQGEAAFVASGLWDTAQVVSRGTVALKAAWLGTGEEE